MRYMQLGGPLRLAMLSTVAVAAVLVAPPATIAQMPDPRSMSGLALPSADLPDATVSIRVIRGQMTNNLSGVEVELHGAGANRTTTTGEDGRAQFTNLPVGARVHAHAVVDGESLQTNEFQIPAQGGVRTLLVFSDASGAPAAAMPSKSPHGSSTAPGLSIGGTSRIALEFREDVLQVFYLLEILNRTPEPIAPPSTLIFDMPRGAAGTTLLDGATPQANARGTRVTVTGPFPPGVTQLPVAFRLDAFGSELTIEQRFPLPFEMPAIAVQKVGDMQVSSPQIARTQDAPIGSSVFVMGTGPPLPAEQPFTLRLSGVPHQSRVPLYIALAVAGLVIALAAWIAGRPGGADAAANRRRTLEARREQELAALATLERQRLEGGIDDTRYAARRATLVTRLERIYGELDVSGPPAGGRGAAA